MAESNSKSQDYEKSIDRSSVNSTSAAEDIQPWSSKVAGASCCCMLFVVERAFIIARLRLNSTFVLLSGLNDNGAQFNKLFQFPLQKGDPSDLNNSLTYSWTSEAKDCALK
jgi:hypothetical protein